MGAVCRLGQLTSRRLNDQAAGTARSAVYVMNVKNERRLLRSTVDCSPYGPVVSAWHVQAPWEQKGHEVGAQQVRLDPLARQREPEPVLEHHEVDEGDTEGRPRVPYQHGDRVSDGRGDSDEHETAQAHHQHGLGQIVA